MATINEIKQQASAVKNATRVGENTAERVGGALAGLADIAEQQDSKLNNILLSNLISKRSTLPLSQNIEEVGRGTETIGIFEEATQTDYKTTDYIKLTDKNYLFECVNALQYGYSSMRIYDSDKKVIFNLTNAENVVYEIKPQANAKYIRYAYDATEWKTHEMQSKLYSIKGYQKEKKYDLLTENKKHTALWLGTSIPAGFYGNFITYPKIVGERLGWNVINQSLGGSCIIKHEGVFGHDGDGKDLAESAEEKKERYQNHIGDGTNGTVTQSRYNEMMDWGYDKKIIPYINGEKASCDIVIIDHGINDRGSIAEELKIFDSVEKSLIKDAKNDRGTFIGAFRFLLQKIYEVNPRIKVVVVSYLENQTKYDTNWIHRGGYEICEMQRKLANTYGLYFANMCDYNGMICRFVKGTENYISNYNKENGTNYPLYNFFEEENENNCCSLYQYMCPDGLHPHSDKTGKTINMIADNLTKLLSFL